jgi:hypothetical protein
MFQKRARTPAEVKTFQDRCSRELASAKARLERARQEMAQLVEYWEEKLKYAEWERAEDFCHECGRAGDYRTCCYDGHP